MSGHDWWMRPARSSILAALVVVLALGAAACSKSGRGSAASTTTTTAAAGTSTTAPGEVVYRSKLYDGTRHWICHPDLATDVCRPQPETVFTADGTVTHRPGLTAGAPPTIDCFYIYPTESQDPGVSADLNIGPTELAVVRAQVARYASVCRVFAPVYRQVTLRGLFSGGLGSPAQALAYGDVLDAWRTYLAQQSHGRGVVLIGHSQGAALLIKLMHDEIDPKPAVRSRLVSAILMGGGVEVPEGKDVGGVFQHIPACRAATQTDCVITFASFPTDALPEPGGSLFGRDPAPGQQVLCVDPVALAGHKTATTVIYRRSILLGAITGLSPGDDPYVVLPGTLTARCVRGNGFTVLAYAPASASDKRPVDILLRETLGSSWGLHLYDANLAQDDLIAVVGTQASAWKPSN